MRNFNFGGIFNVQLYVYIQNALFASNQYYFYAIGALVAAITNYSSIISWLFVGGDVEN